MVIKRNPPVIDAGANVRFINTGSGRSLGERGREAPRLDRRDIVRLPVGPGAVKQGVPQLSVPGVFEIFGPTVGGAPGIAVRSIIRNEEVQIPSGLPQGVVPRVLPTATVGGTPSIVKTGLEIFKEAAANLPIFGPEFRTLMPVQTPSVIGGPIVRDPNGPAPVPGIPGKRIDGGTKMGLDLGNIVGGIGDFITGDFGDLADRFFSPTLPAPIPGPVTTIPTGGIGGGGIPQLPTTSKCDDDDPMKGYVMKKVCGQWKWVKPGRRRRKKLLTDADFNSLLKLQTLKVNTNMTIAIAKALGR